VFFSILPPYSPIKIIRGADLGTSVKNHAYFYRYTWATNLDNTEKFRGNIMFKKAMLTVSLLIATNAVAQLNKTEISAKLQSISAGSSQIIVENVEQSPLPDFYQVITDKGILYAHKDGTHVFSGSLHDFEPGLNNLTTSRLNLIYEETITGLKHDFITYRAPNEKHEVLVFYDTTCGYCHRLHSQIAEYNALGITIHYAAYPRNGVVDPSNPSMPTDAYNQLQNIWCANTEQKNFVFDMVSRGSQVPAQRCDNTIAQQYELGKKMGIRGTPAIIAMNGEQLVPGYTPPKALIKLLDGES
jgi:thiol:disulfide interchange protein DsbC